MKHQADKHRQERQFQVGARVYLKLQPYVQSSVAPRANHKLLFKFYGPYTVTARIGSVAYRLALPPGSRIHPVFHVSQLKAALRPSVQVTPELPSPEALVQYPVRILRRRVRSRGSSSVPQVLVQCSNASDDSATWEDLLDLHINGFHLHQLVPKLCLKEGDISTPGPTTEEDVGPATRPMRRRRVPAWLASEDWVY